MLGQCSTFNRAKGYGFIIPLDDPTLPDVFCHFSDIEHNELWKRRFLLPGMKVQFDLEPEANDPEKFRAKRVRVVTAVITAIKRSAPVSGGAR